MYSFKRIDAVAWKKINLSRHQAQEQLQRRMGVNCESLTMPALQMDFSVCVSYWDAGCMRGGEKKARGRKEVSEKKQFCQLSSKLCDGGNFDPLALSCSLANFPSSHSQDLPQGKLLFTLIETVFKAECAWIHICLVPPPLPTNPFCCLSHCEIVCRCVESVCSFLNRS